MNTREELLAELAEATTQLHTFLDERKEFVESVVNKAGGLWPDMDVQRRRSFAETIGPSIKAGTDFLESYFRQKIEQAIVDLILVESKNPMNKDVFEEAVRNIAEAKTAINDNKRSV